MDIKNFRERYNLSQRELAKILDIPQSTLSYIESGKTKNSKYIKKIEDYLIKHNQYYILTKKYKDVENSISVYTCTEAAPDFDEENKEKSESWFSKIFKFIGVK